MSDKERRYMELWRADWNRFAYDVLKARLDKEQQDILSSVQYNPMTAVVSGVSRGKDFLSACACVCFMYLTPKFDAKGNLIGNTKVAMTAPTARQVSNIMTPEVRRLLRNAACLPGRLVADDIRTNYEEWFLTGFKADDNNTEAWTGFHAVNVMFAVTEASGVSETVFNAIEGNLQGNSRLLIVFNANITTGYAARAMKSSRFAKFRLNSLNAENVVRKKVVIPGQVDYAWVKDKVDTWCTPITKDVYDEGEGDFSWEGCLYRPNDLFRVKILGMFPKVSEDVLIPYEWVELANQRWVKLQEERYLPLGKSCRVGSDVAGMGRDASVLLPRYGNYVGDIEVHNSAGRADHMHVAGMHTKYLKNKNNMAFIDTIGEGAGVFSRLEELGFKNVFSCKFSEGVKGMHDITGQYEFVNMRAYCYWAVRDWLNPKNGFNPAIPPCDYLMEELTEIKWKFHSDGRIIIEPKEEIKKRLKRSPDYSDALANTFYPHGYVYVTDEEILRNVL